MEGKTRLGHSTPFAGGPVRELVMVNAETHNYETPYQLALLKGHMKVVEYLRETAGAMPFVKVFSRCTAEPRKRRPNPVQPYRLVYPFG